MKTKSYFGLFILVLAAFFFISTASAALIQSSVWNEKEYSMCYVAGGCPYTDSSQATSTVYSGQWIRRPGTDTFDATWPSDSDVIVLTSIVGDKITMHRNKHNGDYTGTISSDGKSIRGIYTPIGRGWTETWAVSVTDGTGTIVGAWDWNWGTSQHLTVNYYADGTADVYDGTDLWSSGGKWQKQGNVFVITWKTSQKGNTGPPSTDTLTLSPDGQKVTGTNNWGNNLIGIRKTGTGSQTTQPTKKGCTGSGTSIYVDDRTMNPGQEVVIPIMMCNANDIANMDLSVGYDSSALQFKDAVKGSLNSNVMFESNNVGSKVKIAFAGKNGFSGSGSIAVLTFRVIGQNGASSPITVTVGAASTSGGKSVTIPVNNGNVVIGNPNPNNPGGRDTVTSLDALIALQISVGKRPNDTNYDVTKDGTVNSNDARQILKLAVQ